MLIKIKEDTILKRLPIDSSSLPSEDKINLETSTELTINCVIDLNNNKHIEVLKEDGKWFLYHGHIDMEALNITDNSAIITVKANTIGKISELPVTSGNLSPDKKIIYVKDDTIIVNEVLDHRDKHIRILDNEGRRYWLYDAHIDSSNLPNELFELITLDNLIKIVGNQTLATRYHQGLNRTFAEFDINNCKRQSIFLAQVLHESGGFKWAEEIASGQAYEGRKDLGNTIKGDGVRFKGRGLIQLTGRHNYEVAGKALGLDLINLPQLASNPENAPRIAGWYWNSRGLNSIADQFNIEAFQTITRRINGGLNGYRDRLHWWDRTRRVLGC